MSLIYLISAVLMFKYEYRLSGGLMLAAAIIQLLVEVLCVLRLLALV